MKKLFIPLLAVSVFFTSCGSESTEEQSNTGNETATHEETSYEEEGAGASVEEDLIASIVQKGGAKSEDQLMIENMMSTMEVDNSERNQQIYGHWVGKFGKNMINITLSKIDGETIEGFSVCAGNFRKIVGTLSDEGTNIIDVKMDEPGDDQYDGSFEFTIDLNKNEVSGHWTPYQAEGNTEKDFVLNKKEYVYDVNAGDYDASKKVLSDDFLMELDEWTLGYIRNEIYARHGYSFKNKEWRYEFEGLDWYVPVGIDIRDKLTDVEVANIGLIYEYESYYEDYYDEYGR